MKIGDEVKVKGYDSVFLITGIHEDARGRYYILKTLKEHLILETLKTEKDLAWTENQFKLAIKKKISTQYYLNLRGVQVADALTKMLLQHIPSDEVLDMLNNIEEYME